MLEQIGIPNPRTMLKELKILSEALWESVKGSLSFFSSIQLFVRELAEFDYTSLNKESLKELQLYIQKIEEFFIEYRASGDIVYIPPHETSRNDNTVKKIFELSKQLAALSKEELQKEVETITPSRKHTTKGDGSIFIGHGNSKLWARLHIYLKDELGLKTLFYESESHTAEQIGNVLDDFLSKVSFAIIIMTAEDSTTDGKTRSRQNVVHEAGLFQGRLGFDKVVLIKQDLTEDFSNHAGTQHISFTGENIEQAFYELSRSLRKNGFIS